MPSTASVFLQRSLKKKAPEQFLEAIEGHPLPLSRKPALESSATIIFTILTSW